MKFEDRSEEETERQERCARGKAWNLANKFYKLKEKDKATVYSPTDEQIMTAASTIKPEEREFVVDTGASMHMVSKKDLYFESETMRMSKNPTTVMTANGGVQTREEATVDVKDLDFSWVFLPLDQWSKPLLTNNGKIFSCNTANYVPFVVPGLSTSSSTSSSPDSSTSSSQDSVIGTENPATERSEIVSEESRGNRHVRQQKPKTQIKMKTTEKYEVNYCKMCRRFQRESGGYECSAPALLMNYQWNRE